MGPLSMMRASTVFGDETSSGAPDVDGSSIAALGGSASCAAWRGGEGVRLVQEQRAPTLANAVQATPTKVLTR
jgi:hypothetical protein